MYICFVIIYTLFYACTKLVSHSTKLILCVNIIISYDIVYIQIKPCLENNMDSTQKREKLTYIAVLYFCILCMFTITNIVNILKI